MALISLIRNSYCFYCQCVVGMRLICFFYKNETTDLSPYTKGGIVVPRKARERSRSGIYHIMLRGVNKQMIFEDIEDRWRFLRTVKRYKEVSGYFLYGYALMDNHVHLLIKEGKEGISAAVKRICSSYVYWYNEKYDRYGNLFQGRFRSETVESSGYFLKVLRYIHQNPMKAGLANNVFTSKWTSMNEYLDQVNIVGDVVYGNIAYAGSVRFEKMSTTNLVDVDFALRLFGLNRNEAIIRFVEYMEQPNDDECLEDTVKMRLKDQDVREQLRRLGIESVSVLQQLEKTERDSILVEMKKIPGVSIRQLSRVTGISTSVIHRAGKRKIDQN